MTRKISLITAIAGAALVFAVPAAWGDSWGADRQGQADFWNYDQQTGKKITNSSPGVAPEGLATLYFGATSESSAPVGSPDLVDRVVAARQHELSNMLDAREQALVAKSDQSTVSPLDQRERAFSAKREAQLTSGQYPDVIERAVTARGPIRTPVGDDRFRIDHSNVPAPVSATSSGSELEWPQIGIGFGVGIVLMLGLYLALKGTRTRPLAH